MRRLRVRSLLGPAKGLRLGRLVRVTRTILAASRLYGASPLAVWRRVLLASRLGYRLDQARLIGLLDPALPAEAISEEFLSSGRLLALQLRLDPLPLTRLVHDKALFQVACELAGLPIPCLCCVLYRDGPGWAVDGSSPITRADWAEAFEQVLPSAFVVKPALGDFGDGIRFFERHGATYREGDSLFGGAADLYDSLVESPVAGDGFVVQERLRNHPFLTELSGSETLQTFRMITLVDRTNHARLITVEWKVVTGDALIDNFHDGATGNGLMLVDHVAGTLQGPLVLAGSEGLGFIAAQRHPRTGRILDGVQLPVWEETVELVLRAARAFGKLRTIGWDVAITADGPVLVEGNGLYGPTNEVGSRRLRLALEDAVRDAPTDAEAHLTRDGRRRADRSAAGPRRPPASSSRLEP